MPLNLIQGNNVFKTHQSVPVCKGSDDAGRVIIMGGRLPVMVRAQMDSSPLGYQPARCKYPAYPFFVVRRCCSRRRRKQISLLRARRTAPQGGHQRYLLLRACVRLVRVATRWGGGGQSERRRRSVSTSMQTLTSWLPSATGGVPSALIAGAPVADWMSVTAVVPACVAR